MQQTPNIAASTQVPAADAPAANAGPPACQSARRPAGGAAPANSLESPFRRHQPQGAGADALAKASVHHLRTGVLELDGKFGTGVPGSPLNLTAGTPASGKTTPANRMFFALATRPAQHIAAAPRAQRVLAVAMLHAGAHFAGPPRHIGNDDIKIRARLADREELPEGQLIRCGASADPTNGILDG